MGLFGFEPYNHTFIEIGGPIMIASLLLLVVFYVITEMTFDWNADVEDYNRFIQSKPIKPIISDR